MGIVKEPLPSFSIVLETENLASADVAGLVRSIAALAAQDPSPTCANEVLLIDSGDAPTDLLQHLCLQYPWITIHPAPAGTGYYKAKMLGAERATGDIVVYYDSDCLYEPTWLRTILTPFTQSRQIEVVAGETTTRGVGPYGTAMALTYIFPQFSGQTALTPTTQYFLNNVAFRREFLLRHPISAELPLYRGNCVIHAHELLEQGYTIWRQPQARTHHAPPNGISHFFWRFLLIGHDYYWQQRLLQRNAGLSKEVSSNSMAGFQGKLQVFYDRLNRLLLNDRRHGLFLPLALPIVILSALLIYVGYLVTIWKPHYLLRIYSDLLGE